MYSFKHFNTPNEASHLKTSATFGMFDVCWYQTNYLCPFSWKVNYQINFIVKITANVGMDTA